MTICIATSIYYPVPGGIPNYCKYLADNLMAEGHRVVILTIDHSGKNIADELIREHNYIKVVLKRSYLEMKAHYDQFFRPGGYEAPGWIAAGMAMKDWLMGHHKDFKIDIIETNDYGGLGIFLADDQLPPVLVIGHSSIIQLAKYNHTPEDDHAAVLQQLERLSFQHCDAIVAHSPMNQSSLHELTGKNIRFARAPWTLPMAQTNKEENKNIVAGGLQMTKGAQVMAEAIKIITQQRPSWQLNWIGGDTFTAPGGEKVSAFLSSRYPATWSKNFVWEQGQSHEKVMTAIATAGLVIIPSIWDTFNYSALEAVYFKRPLIMTEQTGAAYLFKNDKNIRIVPAAANAIADIIAHEPALEEWKRSIDNSSKENLIHYFSPAAIVKERMKIYEEVTGQQKKQGDLPTESLHFLKQYTTTARKLYYTTRKWAKRIVKGD